MIDTQVSRTVWRRLSEPFGTSTDLDSSTVLPNGEKQWAFAKDANEPRRRKTVLLAEPLIKSIK